MYQIQEDCETKIIFSWKRGIDKQDRSKVPTFQKKLLKINHILMQYFHVNKNKRKNKYKKNKRIKMKYLSDIANV